MEFLIIAIIILINIIILKYIFGYNKKQLKHIADNEELDKITSKYPSNKELAKEYLKMLNNSNVKIEENNETDTSLYIAITNKILIANVRNSYTRIQTIAHECLHSVQDRKLLVFNFILSNVYIFYFICISVLAVLRKMSNKMLGLSVLSIIGIAFISVRTFLENDAMIKARYLAKEYMEKQGVSDKNEINKIIEEFDKINNVGIKCTNYGLYIMIMCQILIFDLICIIR